MGNLIAPPYRPDDWHWQIMSDLERDAYLIQVFDWLDRIGMDPRWLSKLIEMSEWYNAYADYPVIMGIPTRMQIVDPNWVRGGVDR